MRVKENAFGQIIVHTHRTVGWVFESLNEARDVAEAIRLYYNAKRPAAPTSEEATP